MAQTNNPDARIGDMAALTREEADRMYRATGPIPNPGAILEDFIRDSRLFRERHGGVFDVAYGPDEEQRLDIFLPAGVTAKAPVHIFIHGGYWYQFGKDEWSFVAEALTAAGAIVIVPRYTLCPAVGIGDIVRQMREMLVWTWQSIGNHGGDRDRIFLSGHSAGGHLALEMLLTDWQADHGLPSTLLKGVTAISGLFDLTPITATYVQEFVRLSAEDAARLSPAARIVPNGTPLILAVADEDPRGFHRQTAMLAASWKNAGNEGITIALGGNHLTELYDLSRPEGKLAIAIKAQMKLEG